MEDILLILLMLAVFAFVYHAVDRFGKFMDECEMNYDIMDHKRNERDT